MRCIVAILFLSLISSCKLAQDVGYTRWQVEQGLATQAEASLLALSDDGYMDAKMALADLYSTSDDIKKRILAGDYYRELITVSDRAEYKYVRWLEQMSYVDESYRIPAYQALTKRQRLYHDLYPSLARFYSYHSEFYSSTALEDLLTELFEDSAVSQVTIATVLNSIDHPERYYENITSICGQNPKAELRSECYQLEFKVAKIAKDRARIEELVSRLKEELQPVPENSKQLTPDVEKILYSCATVLLKEEYGGRQILAGLSVANLGQDVSTRLFLLSAKAEYKRKIFMTDDTLLSGLQKLEVAGNPDATRLLGRMYAEGLRVVDDPLKAESYLLKITDDPEAALYLGRLYLSGKLGTEKIQDGVNALLYAARNGRSLAYYSLAEAFNGSPGIKANPLFSWVFANMAKTTLDTADKTEEMGSLINTLASDIKDGSEAERMLQSEQTQMHKGRFKKVRK